MTTVQRVAQIIGWISVIIGILAFFVTGFGMEASVATAPRLFGLFPFNFLHALVHVGLGIWGIAAARAWSSARSYCRITGIIFIVLGFLGFIIPRFFGIMPIGSHNIWLHFILGVILAYAGFTAREAPPARAAP